MELLDTYIDTRNKIYDYFNYQQQWHVSPIVGHREMYWHIARNQLIYVDGENKEDAIDNIDDESYYSGHILAIYRKPDFTMIEVDTQTDGNSFCMIFDSTRELSAEDCKEFEDMF